MSRLKEILEKIDPELFTEEDQNELAELINEKVEDVRSEMAEVGQYVGVDI